MDLVPETNPLKPCTKKASSMMRLELQENEESVRHNKGSMDLSSKVQLLHH